MTVAIGKNLKSRQTEGAVVGDVVLQGQGAVKVMHSGTHLQLVELRLKKGFYHPLHNHPANESIGYVISGQLEMKIGDETYLLGPGDAWHHGIGVHHYTKALEDTYAIESHSPLRDEYTSA